MMTWTEIRLNGQFLRHLPQIWETEAAMPQWFKASSFLWQKTFDEFVRWSVDAQEIHGLFDAQGRFMACVYIEKQEMPEQAVIHCSVVEKIAPEVFVAKCSELRDRLFHRGIRVIRGWTLRKNFSLVKLMKQMGFEPLGLTMDQGDAHGQVLRWDLMQVRTA